MIFFNGTITEKKGFLLFYPGNNLFFIKIELISKGYYFKQQSNQCPLVKGKWADCSPTPRPKGHWLPCKDLQ